MNLEILVSLLPELFARRHEVLDTAPRKLDTLL